ncbi:unnamed protein product [Spodoptera exigua]|nr:unnamed protein product [Spodoptera exigua]
MAVSVLVQHQTGVFALTVLNFREHFAFCVKRASSAARGLVRGGRRHVPSVSQRFTRQIYYRTQTERSVYYAAVAVDEGDAPRSLVKCRYKQNVGSLVTDLFVSNRCGIQPSQSMGVIDPSSHLVPAGGGAGPAAGGGSAGCRVTLHLHRPAIAPISQSLSSGAVSNIAAAIPAWLQKVHFAANLSSVPPDLPTARGICSSHRDGISPTVEALSLLQYLSSVPKLLSPRPATDLQCNRTSEVVCVVRSGVAVAVSSVLSRFAAFSRKMAALAN